MSACVRLHPGASASVTRTFVSVTSPVFVTVIVQFAVPPDGIVWRFGSLTIPMLGCVGGGGGGDSQSLVALPLFACPGAACPVVRVMVTPPTTTVVEACIVSVPPTADVVVTVHAPATVVQVFGPTNEPTEPASS